MMVAVFRCATSNPLHMPAEGLWCAPGFRLDAEPPATRLIEDSAAASLGAFRIRSLLSRREAEGFVRAADAMGFTRSASDSDTERRNGALSWALHDPLREALSARIAPFVPRAICSHSGEAAPERRAEMLRAEAARRALLGGGGSAGGGGEPWVRRGDGAPEGTYRYEGLNARCRVYRYEPGGSDRFAPHFDECWPGSTLALKGTGGGEEATLVYDGWTYGADATATWQWGPRDRVSHLSVLVYLNDGFPGGETALLQEDGGGGGSVCVAPSAGDALCFGQSFALGRPGVCPSERALLHEGRPVAAAPPRASATTRAPTRRERRRSGRRGGVRAADAPPPPAKIVMRSDLLYWIPPPES